MNAAYAKQFREVKDHSGWTNYPTWAAALWINNDEGTYGRWRDEAHEIRQHIDRYGSEHWTEAETLVFTLEDRLKDAHEQGQPEGASVYSDLTRWALAYVNWREVAESIIEGLDA